MSAWPQTLVIAWLALTITSGVAAAARPARGWIVLTRQQQRIAAAAFAAAACGEATLLWQGGFFQGIF